MRRAAFAITLAGSIGAAGFTGVQAQHDADQEFAGALWAALEQARMVGDDMIQTRPYEGTEPHGVILEYLEDEIEVDGRTATAIVKTNFGPDATIEQVWSGNRENLAAITVMYRMEEGYDPEHGNWFWAKYLPDGSLDQTPEGMPMAGQVPGCIQCHQGAPGDDYIFSYDR